MDIDAFPPTPRLFSLLSASRSLLSKDFKQALRVPFAARLVGHIPETPFLPWSKQPRAATVENHQIGVLLYLFDLTREAGLGEV